MFSVDTLAKVEKLQICLQRFKKEEQAMAFGRRKVGGWGKLNNESASREKRTASHGQEDALASKQALLGVISHGKSGEAKRGRREF